MLLKPHMIKQVLESYGPLMGKRFSTAIVACAAVMTGGNVFALTAAHISVAAQVAAITAILIVAFLKVRPTFDVENTARMAMLSFVMCCVADLMVHPSSFWGAFGEPIVTGLLAGGLAYAASRIKQFYFWIQ